MPKSFIKLKHLRQREAYSCVPACVRMLLQYYGDGRTEEDLCVLLGCMPYGTSAEGVARVSGLGYEVELRYSTFEELKALIDAGQPVMVFVRTGGLDYWSEDCPHAVVVVGYDEDSVYIDDPYFEDAPQRTRFKTFRVAWWRTRNRLAVIRPRQIR